jgi:hypothetical protein
MRQLNTFPIEDFLDKARIAIKTNQKTLVLSIKEVADLQSSLATVMTRLAGNADQSVSTVEVKMDGGRF